MLPVPLGDQYFVARYLPFDIELRVIEGNSPLMPGRIWGIHFIGENGLIAQDGEPMRKPGRNKKHLPRRRIQLNLHRLPESGTALAQVHQHILHATYHYPRKLALRKRRQLVMQSANNAIARAGLVILHKANGTAKRGIQHRLAISLKKFTTFIAVNPWGQQQDIGKYLTFCFHGGSQLIWRAVTITQIISQTCHSAATRHATICGTLLLWVSLFCLLFDMASLLVTGGAGFIGANFVHYWLRQHPLDTVVVLDALTYAGNLHSLPEPDAHPQLHFVHDNICNTAGVIEIMQAHRTDTLVHFAAESHVDRSIAGPDTFLETNIIGTHSLLKAARRVWLEAPTERGEPLPAHRFHHVSTDEVFGSLAPDMPGSDEHAPYAPNSPYSASKAASDHLVRAYARTYGLHTTSSHCSNNYGPYHYPEKLIPLTITHILNDRTIPVFGDGLHMRDWLYVTDHVHAIARILQQGRQGETYNIGGDSGLTNTDVVHRICRAMDHAFATRPDLHGRFPQAKAAQRGQAQSLIRFVNDRPGHDRRYALDTRKIREELGFVPQIEFDEGLCKTLDWFLENQTWWREMTKS